MNESHHDDPHAPLSYYGARRIVWLVFFVFIIWLILRALQPVILLFALVFLLAMVLNPIVLWLQKRRIPRLLAVILVMLALVAVTTTIILFAIPPLSRQLQELTHSTPNMWQGIRTRIESVTKNYPQVREALPRTDEMAGKVGAAAATVGNFLLQSTLGLVGGVASALLAILLLIFVLANPRPLVTAYLALAPDRYREQAHRTGLIPPATAFSVQPDPVLPCRRRRGNVSFAEAEGLLVQIDDIRTHGRALCAAISAAKRTPPRD